MGSSSAEVSEVVNIYLWGMWTQNLFQNLTMKMSLFIIGLVHNFEKSISALPFIALFRSSLLQQLELASVHFWFSCAGRVPVLYPSGAFCPGISKHITGINWMNPHNCLGEVDGQILFSYSWWEQTTKRDELIQSLITTQCVRGRRGNSVQDEILALSKTMLKLPIDYSGQVRTSSFLMASLLYPQNCGIIFNFPAL